MSEWRPIDTAPKDGTSVLGYWDRRYSDGTRYEVANPMVVMWFDRGRWWPDWLPTAGIPGYWMPLPAPPTDEQVAQRAGA
jgi:hypothetical protein